MLYIVATPIGNLQDMTFRAIETLKNVDLIAAEDTRTSGILCKHYEITTPLISFHSHSGAPKVEKLLNALREGKSVALISDAGTPGICDPGYQLIQAVLTELPTVEIVPIPGAAAVVTALSVCGFPTHNFLFLGFLPVKKGRQTLFTKMADSDYTIVFYESVHRLEKTLNQLIEFGMGDRQMCLARELTKQFETIYRGTVTQIAKQSPKLKGEFTCIVAPSDFSR